VIGIGRGTALPPSPAIEGSRAGTAGPLSPPSPACSSSDSGRTALAKADPPSSLPPSDAAESGIGAEMIGGILAAAILLLAVLIFVVLLLRRRRPIESLKTSGDESGLGLDSQETEGGTYEVGFTEQEFTNPLEAGAADVSASEVELWSEEVSEEAAGNNASGLD
jgi:hypothetical protein